MLMVILLFNSPKANGGQLSDLTVRMSKLGCSGRYPNNIERDLVTLLQLPVPFYWVEIPVRNEQNRKDVEIKKLPILCPHSLYHYLFVSWINLSKFVFFVTVR